LAFVPLIHSADVNFAIYSPVAALQAGIPASEGVTKLKSLPVSPPVFSLAQQGSSSEENPS
jgi:hypothetical protein